MRKEKNSDTQKRNKHGKMISKGNLSTLKRVLKYLKGNIVFLIGREDLFALKVLALDLIEQVRVTTILDIVQNRFWRHSSPFTF